MTETSKLGCMTVILAADIADSAHPINKIGSSQSRGSLGVQKVLGRMYLRDNGSEDYDVAIPLEEGPTGKWIIIGTGGEIVTPSA